MIVTLSDTKEYLRVDTDDENALIISFINTAEDIISGILRYSLETFTEEMPEIIKTAVYYIASQLYELRESVDMTELIDTVKKTSFFI